MFFLTIIVEIIQICWETSSVVQFIKTSKSFLYEFWWKVLIKIINHHVHLLEKNNSNNKNLIQHQNLFILILFHAYM